MLRSQVPKADTFPDHQSLQRAGAGDTKHLLGAAGTSHGQGGEAGGGCGVPRGCRDEP